MRALQKVRSLFPGNESPSSPHPYSAPDTETTFDMLRSQRRRRVVEELVARDDGAGVDLGELTDAIAVAETDGATDRADVSSDDRKAVYVGLYQTHIPKLESAGALKMTDDNIVYAKDGAYALKHIIEEVITLTEADA